MKYPASTMSLEQIICMSIISCCLSYVNGQSPDQTHIVYEVNYPSIRPLLSEIIGRLDELEQQHDTDRRMMSDLVRRVTDLEAMHAKDTQQMAEMTSNIEELKTENARLHDKVGTPPPLLPGTQRSAGSTDNSLNTADRERTLIEGNGIFGRRMDDAIPKMRVELRDTPTDAPITAVAFYAILAHEIADTSQDSAIVFDNIVTNVGGHYSQFTGTFTTVQAGLHVFHWTVKSDFNSWIISELVRNGSVLGTDLSTYPNYGSATAIAVLETGDRVWVRITSKAAGAEIQPIFTTFSGFLIQTACTT